MPENKERERLINKINYVLDRDGNFTQLAHWFESTLLDVLDYLEQEKREDERTQGVRKAGDV